MIKLLTGVAVAALISTSAAHAIDRNGEFRGIYSDDPGVVLQAPYQTGDATRDGRNLYVGDIDETTFGLVVGDVDRNAGTEPTRMSQQYKVLSDDSGVVLQAPFQN